MFEVPEPQSEFPPDWIDERMDQPPRRLSHNRIKGASELSSLQIAIRAAHLRQQAGLAESREGGRALANAEKLEALPQAIESATPPRQAPVEALLQLASHGLNRIREIIGRNAA